MSWAQQKNGRTERTSPRIGISGIAKRFGVTEQVVKQWAQEFSFPRPAVPGVWTTEAVDGWHARNIQSRKGVEAEI